MAAATHPIDDRPRWQRLLPDLLGTGVALALAWFMGWRTGDLIWSMWLASLVIGYSLILWNLFGPLIPLIRQRGEIGAYAREAPWGTAAGLAALLFGQLFLLAFFTVHFGGFHWGHSIFVHGFYPISPTTTGEEFAPALSEYWYVVKTYGWFIPLAFFAQRDLFKDRPDENAVSGGLVEDIEEDAARAAQRKRRPRRAGADMGVAYRGVIKLHLLIFFLFGADAVGLPEFLSFVVVYLVYFLNWKEILPQESSRRTS
jgi:hypothetical protein